MNKQTRSFHSRNLSTRVIKGAAVPKEGKSAVGESLEIKEFPSFKGSAVDSTKGRVNGRTPNGFERKQWKGCGNPLGR